MKSVTVETKAVASGRLDVRISVVNERLSLGERADLVGEVAADDFLQGGQHVRLGLG